MKNMDHNAHSVYLMYYHLIMVVKYRRKVINDPISEFDSIFLFCSVSSVYTAFTSNVELSVSPILTVPS